MWFGITHLTAGDTPQAADGDFLLIAIYRPDGTRVMRVGAPVTAMADVVRMMRGASSGAPRGRPRCGNCGSAYGIPDLDAAQEVQSCASI